MRTRSNHHAVQVRDACLYRISTARSGSQTACGMSSEQGTFIQQDDCEYPGGWCSRRPRWGGNTNECQCAIQWFCLWWVSRCSSILKFHDPIHPE